MDREIQVFRSPQTRAQYDAAYQAMLEQWPSPYAELYVKTRFGDTHLVANGPETAPPLFLFHSAGSGSLQWFRNVGPLSKHYRTYSVDTIGEVNKSVLNRKLRSRQDFVDWILDLFTALKIDKADLVGNSYGGFIAFNTALYLPERVRKVVLIGPAAVFKQIWAFYWHIAFPYKVGYTLHSDSIILNGFKWIWQGFPRDECFKNYYELSRTTGFPGNSVPPPIYSDEELRQIDTPVLLLIGDHEVVYKPEPVIERATRLVKGLEAEIIPNANHNAQVTAAEVVNEKILKFLNGED